MPERLPIQDAIEVARRLFASHVDDGARPLQSRLIEVVREFEPIEFDVPESTDADGFLFQFGSVSWFTEPTFTLGITRQFDVVDSEGKHEMYLQVAMDFHFTVDAALDEVDSYSSWWFRSSGEDFSAWLDLVEGNPIWQRVSGKIAREFAISSDEV